MINNNLIIAKKHFFIFFYFLREIIPEKGTDEQKRKLIEQLFITSKIFLGDITEKEIVYLIKRSEKIKEKIEYYKYLSFKKEDLCLKINNENYLYFIQLFFGPFRFDSSFMKRFIIKDKELKSFFNLHKNKIKEFIQQNKINNDLNKLDYILNYKRSIIKLGFDENSLFFSKISNLNNLQLKEINQLINLIKEKEEFISNNLDEFISDLFLIYSYIPYKDIIKILKGFLIEKKPFKKKINNILDISFLSFIKKFQKLHYTYYKEKYGEIFEDNYKTNHFFGHNINYIKSDHDKETLSFLYKNYKFYKSFLKNIELVNIKEIGTFLNQNTELGINTCFNKGGVNYYALGFHYLSNISHLFFIKYKNKNIGKFYIYSNGKNGFIPNIYIKKDFQRFIPALYESLNKNLFNPKKTKKSLSKSYFNNDYFYKKYSFYIETLIKSFNKE